VNESFPLAEETPVELVANGERIAVLMCTPLNLDDLAAGHLFTRGMLTDASRIKSLIVREDLSGIDVLAPGAISADCFGLGQVVASGFGSGSAVADAARLGTVPPGFSIQLETLKSWSRTMFQAAVIYRQTGGMHCAAIACALAHPEGSPYFVVREDVGRHNAVDKVIGRAFMDGVDFPSACILTSGRIAADMILKAVAARVPVIVSRSIPTSTAFGIAREAGVTMVGRIGDDHPIVYTNPERIRL
jgi:FdhD protein